VERSYEGLDLVPEAVVVVSGARNVLHVNDRAAALLGTTDDVVGKPLRDALVLLDDAGNVCEDPVGDDPGGQRIAERVLRVSPAAGGARRACAR
jgi:PAS domain-containing protein